MPKWHFHITKSRFYGQPRFPLFFHVARKTAPYPPKTSPNPLQLPRPPVKHGGVDGHAAGELGVGFVDDLAGEVGEEAGFEFGTGAVDADFFVGYRGEQQAAVGGDAAGFHVVLDDAAGLAQRVGEVGAVGADDQGEVGGVEEVKAAPDADDPFAVFDVEGALLAGGLGADFGDVGEVAA